MPDLGGVDVTYEIKFFFLDLIACSTVKSTRFFNTRATLVASVSLSG